jgi:hypothetical protein
MKQVTKLLRFLWSSVEAAADDMKDCDLSGVKQIGIDENSKIAV